MERCCQTVELRRYTLHPGQREVLIGLFDREFVETQEAVSMGVIGQFRDLDDADRFVWLRGFPDMPSRAEAPRAFLAFFEDTIGAALRDTGAPPLAYFVTETSANNYPALPVREGEHVFVWFSLFPDESAFDEHVAAFSRHGAEVSDALEHRLGRPPEVLRLSPTARSLVHG